MMAILLFASGRLFAETASADKPHIRIPYITARPNLQDYLDRNKEPQGLRIADFRQREPNDGAPAQLDTRVFLSYDDRNLYAIFLCKQDHSSLRAHVSRREDITEDDRVSLTLDTFHDGRRAYEFFSNPLGVQKDGIITEGQDDDFNFDAVWNSEGQLTPDGYAVLLAIPFKSLRFQRAAESTWGIAVGRYSPATREFSTWPYMTEQVQAYVSQFAFMEAVAETSPGRNLQLIPYVAVTGQRFLDDAGAPPFMRTQNEFRAGFDGKYVLHNALTFDFTVHPDFSQIESDEPQVTVNQRYEVFFPEKRPFFTEGAGFFQTPEDLFFSRRIVDPQLGLRMTGKVAGWALGLLSVDDRAEGRTLPSDDAISAQRANINVVRVQREVGSQSTVGFLYSRRRFGAESNDVFGVDARFKLGENWVLTGQAVRSLAHDHPTGRSAGSDYFAEIEHSGLHLNTLTSYLDRSPDFRADLGFIPRVDIRQARHQSTYRWRPRNSSLVSFGPTVDARAVWDHHGQLQEWLLDTPFTLAFKGPTSISVGHIEELETFQNIRFREHANYVEVSTQRLRWFGIDATYTHGTNINFFPAEGSLPFLGTSDDLSVQFTVRPTARLHLEETYLYSRLGAIANRQAVFNDHLFQTKFNYQFTRSLSLRAIVDYAATLPNSTLISLDHSKRLTGDVLLAYMTHPGTAIYVGYTNRRENIAFNPDPILGMHRTNTMDLQTGSQLFVKFSYLIRF